MSGQGNPNLNPSARHSGGRQHGTAGMCRGIAHPPGGAPRYPLRLTGVGVAAAAALALCLLACMASPAPANPPPTSSPMLHRNTQVQTTWWEHESAQNQNGKGTPGTASRSSITFADDELEDAKKQGVSIKLEQGCTAEGCLAHCRQRQHVGARCGDADLCVCRDLRRSHEVAESDASIATVAGKMNNIVNNNNNNVIMLH